MEAFIWKLKNKGVDPNGAADDSQDFGYYAQSCREFARHYIPER